MEHNYHISSVLEGCNQDETCLTNVMDGNHSALEAASVTEVDVATSSYDHHYSSNQHYNQHQRETTVYTVEESTHHHGVRERDDAGEKPPEKTLDNSAESQLHYLQMEVYKLMQQVKILKDEKQQFFEKVKDLEKENARLKANLIKYVQTKVILQKETEVTHQKKEVQQQSSCSSIKRGRPAKSANPIQLQQTKILPFNVNKHGRITKNSPDGPPAKSCAELQQTKVLPVNVSRDGKICNKAPDGQRPSGSSGAGIHIADIPSSSKSSKVLQVYLMPIGNVKAGQIAKQHPKQQSVSSTVGEKSQRKNVPHDTNNMNNDEEDLCESQMDQSQCNNMSPGSFEVKPSKFKRKRYFCEKCDLLFGSLSDLIEHNMFVHLSKQMWKCNICGMGFDTKDQLIQHMKSHPNQKNILKTNKVNKPCGERYNQNSRLKNNTTIHLVPKGVGMCQNPGKNQSTYSLLNNSKYKDLQAKPSKCKAHNLKNCPGCYYCDVCGKTFTDRSYFRQHRKMHFSTESHTCKVCGKSFKMRKILRTHMRIHSDAYKLMRLSKKTQIFHCNTCGKALRSRTSLITHRQRHAGIKPYKCEICGNSYSFKKSLQTHILTHTGERPYACDMCDMRFKRSDYLKSHKLVHTGQTKSKKPKPRVLCDLCGRTFSGSDRRYLVMHMKKHLRLESHSCTICGKTYPVRKLLSSHMRTHMKTNKESDKHMCDICGKVLSNPGSFRDHVKRHSGLRPFKCDICGFCSPSKFDLKKHQQTHSNERPFMCDVCGMKFKRIDNLRKHKLTHLRKIAPVAPTQVGLMQAGQTQVDATQMGLTQGGLTQMGGTLVGATQMDSTQMGAIQMGSMQDYATNQTYLGSTEAQCLINPTW